MLHHRDLTDAQVWRLIRNGQVAWAGNRRLKIYGTLQCWSGKRMLRKNRVFFETEKEATDAGYRPCKHCMNV